MADTQNPISSQDPITPVTTSADLLGDISLDFPAGSNTPSAPVEVPVAQPTESVQLTSDLGSVMLEQSIEATQQKAESVPVVTEDLTGIVAEPLSEVVENTPAPMETITLDLPQAPIEEVKAEPISLEESAPIASVETPIVSIPEAQTTPSPSSDALNIDLGDLSSSTTTPEDTSAKRVFMPLETDIGGPAVTPPPAPASDPSLIIPNLPAAEGAEEVAVTSIEAPVPAPFIEPVPEIMPDTTPVVEPVPMETPSEPTMVEALTSNEQVHLNNESPIETPAEELPVATEIPVVSEEVTPEVQTPVQETTLDLDSLTSEIEAATAGNGTTMPTIAQSSVTLPVENTAILKPHSSLKKKVFVSLAGFILLATVGVMVAKVMFPIESDKLLGSILGGESETTETPLVIDESSSEIPTPVEEAIVEVDTGAIDTGSLVSTEEVVTPEVVPPTISASVAEATLTSIADESRKGLATAIKTKNQTAQGLLYKTFKDSSALLETLANTSDISTIPTIGEDISALQKDLTYATSLLDETNTQTES